MKRIADWYRRLVMPEVHPATVIHLDDGSRFVEAAYTVKWQWWVWRPRRVKTYQACDIWPHDA